MVKNDYGQNLTYQCDSCSRPYPKWQGKCDGCNEWNTVTEKIIYSNDLGSKNEWIKYDEFSSDLIHLDSDFNDTNSIRFDIKWNEIERAIGGHFVAGSSVLLAGMPGVGKSTLLMQLSSKFSMHGKVIYVCGEESISQVKDKFQRFDIKEKDIALSDSVNINNIVENLNKFNPKCLILDSVQTVYDPETQGNPGSINQILNSIKKLIFHCKKLDILFLMSGHVTKTGDVAGPKLLEHMVDVVLQLEYFTNRNERILRSYKNRFGSTSDIGLFDMTTNGFIDVQDPSSIMIEDYNSEVSGSILIPIPSGQRLVFYELQALIAKSYNNYPKKLSEGYDTNRLSILISVLNKICKIPLGNHDVIINVMKGQSIKNVYADFGVCLGILSSLYSTGFMNNVFAIGEVALTGEIRNPPDLEKILKEGKRLGIQKAFIGKIAKNSSYIKDIDLDIVTLDNISEIGQIFK